MAEHVCGEEGQDRALAVCALQAERPPWTPQRTMMLSMESLAVLPLARAEGIFLEALKSSVEHASFLFIYSIFIFIQ